jgi:iron complex outermembrane receptor protein
LRLRAAFIASLVFPATVQAAAPSASLIGRVVDGTGAPIAGAVVVVAYGRGQTQAEAVSDRDGRFSIEGLPAGSASLRVSMPGFRPATSVRDLAQGPNDMGETGLLPGRTEEVTVREYASAAGTKTDSALRDVPQSISLIPASLLEEQQPVRLTEAATNASGIAPAYGLGGTTESFAIRGFAPDFSFGGIYRNGIPLRFSGGFEEPMNLDRLEVMKGPASALYGQGQLAGFVNMVTKRPLPVRRNEISVGFDDHEYRKVAVDLTGPMNASRTLQYRLVSALEDSGNFREFVDLGRYFVAPSVSWRPGPRTSLTLWAEIAHQDRDYDFGIPLVDNRPADIPRERNLSEPWSRVDYDANRFGYEFSQAVDPQSRWTLRSTLRHQDATDEDVFVLPSYTADPAVLNRAANFLFQPSRTTDLTIDTIGAVQTGSVRHSLLFGFDYYSVSSGFQFAPNTTTPINIYEPGHGAPEPPLPEADEDTPRTESRSLGFYAQTQTDLSRSLKLLVGGRYSQEKGDAFFRIADDDAFTPRAGIVYQPNGSVSLYASYSTSFLSNSNSSRRFDGQAVEPQRGQQLEAGVKADLARGRLTLTVAAYRLEKQNVPIPDPAHPGFVLVEGEQGGPGFEVEVSARPRPGLSLSANFGFADATVIRSNNATEGKQLPNFPKASGRFWGSWTGSDGRWRGLGFGLGVTVKDEQYGDALNTFTLDGFAIADAAIFYDRPKWRLALNVKNIFDDEYFESGSFLRTVIPGSPRTFLLSLSARP